MFPSRSCETLLRGSLVARYYYVYAIDYDRGGEWSGQAFMCSRDKEFTIRGIEDCLARGYDRTGFFEVDTGEQRSWTVQLTEIRRAGAGAAVAARPAHHGPIPQGSRPSDETAPPRQDRRHARTRILQSGDASRSLFQAGADVFRINMSHTSHDAMRELVAMIRAVEKDNRPADRHPGRSARPEAAARHRSTAAPRSSTKGDTFTLDADTAPGNQKRVLPAASGNLRRRQSPATPCCSTTARCG